MTGIRLPHDAEYVSYPEVFNSEEAAEIFIYHYATGHIPGGYMLRPIEGYT
ncbi:hypothetical protein [Mycobacteroides salmoniphilum]|uniref:hypothetical protein n=1 Tax=Mycobacteroides salmoniphilum TaxID=404941 RepID=UPI0012FF7792|nr:hypothetical protein [Mycobacteroides salmoniphilum]